MVISNDTKMLAVYIAFTQPFLEDLVGEVKTLVYVWLIYMKNGFWVNLKLGLSQIESYS